VWRGVLLCVCCWVCRHRTANFCMSKSSHDGKCSLHFKHLRLACAARADRLFPRVGAKAFAICCCCSYRHHCRYTCCCCWGEAIDSHHSSTLMTLVMNLQHSQVCHILISSALGQLAEYATAQQAAREPLLVCYTVQCITMPTDITPHKPWLPTTARMTALSHCGTVCLANFKP
jgi:hypothetical protein